MTERTFPGVFIEETSTRARSIEGVSTTVAGFVGPATRGPAVGAPEALTSFADFTDRFGDTEDIASGPNHLALAARFFFEEGGRRLHVARVEGVGGQPPTAAAYRGTPGDQPSGLAALAAIDAISLVAAPGSSGLPEGRQVRAALVEHAESTAFQFAVLDLPLGATVADATAVAAEVASNRATLCYPWVEGSPSGRTALLPPTGFVTGAMARDEIGQSPVRSAGELVLRTAAGLESSLSRPELDRLRAAGVSPLHLRSGLVHLASARTISTDPEWKYVSLRRYFLFLEHSIARGMHWAVFEPNDEPLWARVRGIVSDFLSNEWQRGALLGRRPEEAFFVRCDRTTMTPADIDSGRLICLIGVAMLKPAEFVILRIGQRTAVGS
jgi:phage tail sheath protein FI